MQLLQLLQASPFWLTVVVFIFGLLVGSFLNVVIHRLPLMLQRSWQDEARVLLDLPGEEPPSRFNLVVPPSRCPSCGHQIHWYENIPVVSWLALRGRCSSCNTPIAKRYPLVELAAAVMAATIAWHFGYGLWLLFGLYASWALLAMTMIDFDTTLLPDVLTYPFLWAGILAALLKVSPLSLQDAVIGAMAGYLTLWSVYWLFKLVTGKEGMGYGDFKLFGGLGAWVGWHYLPVVLLLASVVGAVVGTILLQTGMVRRDQGIPFGPYLAAAGWITLLWGQPMVQSYLGLLHH